MNVSLAKRIVFGRDELVDAPPSPSFVGMYSDVFNGGTFRPYFVNPPESKPVKRYPCTVHKSSVRENSFDLLSGVTGRAKT